MEDDPHAPLIVRSCCEPHLSRSVTYSGELAYSLKRPQPVSRRPFHYPLDGSGRIQRETDLAIAATLNRYRYYNRLADPSIDTLSIPDHVVPESFFHPFLLIPESQRYSGKQSSLVTIFAMWNTMMGSSLLSMPWAFEQAGFALSLILLFLMGLICMYTAYRIISLPKMSGLGSNVEFSDIATHYWGQPGKWLSLIFSLIPLLGGAVVYWVLMTNFFYNSVLFFYETISGEMSTTPGNGSSTDIDVLCVVGNPVDTNTSFLPSNVTLPNDLFYRLWDIDGTVPFFLVLCLGPVVSLKSPAFFNKFNALGTVSVFYLILFAVTKSANWGLHFNIWNPDSSDYIHLFKFSFPALTGILSLAFFIHNGVLTLFRNQRNPEKNGRDLAIAFILVGCTYIIIGSVFYLFFPLKKDCIEDNILNNFRPSDVLTVVTRVFLLFQLVTLFPLIVYWSRIQFMYAVFNSVYPGLRYVLVWNTLVITLCILFAIYLPHIGTIIRYCGALSGLAYIFTFPNLFYLKALKLEGQLRCTHLVVHLFIVFLGVVNFAAQFYV